MHNELPIAEVVKALINVLGSKLVAVIGGVKKTSIVRAWERGEAIPPCERRLRYALEATIVLLEEGPAVTRAWWVGTNTHFDHKPPILMLQPGRRPRLRLSLQSA